MDTDPNLGDIEFWRIETVIEKVGLSRSEIYRRIQIGTFPPNRRYPGHGHSKFWLARDVRAWMQAVIDGQFNQPVPPRENLLPKSGKSKKELANRTLCPHTQNPQQRVIDPPTAGENAEMSEIISFTDEQNRRSAHALGRLSFVEFREDGSIDVWPVTETAGSYESDNAIGRARADELAAYMADHGGAMVLGHIVKRVAERGVYSALEIGLFHQIAQYAASGGDGSVRLTC